MYLETRVPPPPLTLRVDGTAYDVDCFGMDDGVSEEPDTARRLLFQLGSGYMIYLYVIQAGSQRALGDFYHTFWTKDCAVAEVDAVEHGPPDRVEATDLQLPVLFPFVVVGGARHAVADVRFSATFSPDAGQRLEISFALASADAPARLLWRHPGGYALQTSAGERALPDDERFHFEPA